MSQQRTQRPRQYGAEEVQEILQRTSSLERKKQLDRPTMELSEIEAIAKEAGLDPALVRRAAQDFEQKRGEKSLGAMLTGGPTKQVFERELDGEITTEMHEVLAAQIRSAIGPTAMMGQLSAIGRTLTWTGFARPIMLELTVFPLDGKTVIRLEVNASQLAGGVFGGLMGGVGGGLGVNLAWMLPVAAHLPWYSGAAGLTAALAGSWALARVIYGLFTSRLNSQLATLLDKLEHVVREEVAKPNP